jgi:transcriptional regulator with XRE-family HTH domain
VTDSELIRAIGEALFGTRWQTDVADALGVSSRTVRRWLTGEDQPRPDVWRELHALLTQRGQQIRELLDGDALARRIGGG